MLSALAANTVDAEGWHAHTVDGVLSELATTTNGLSDAEARRRLAAEGPNELRAVARTSAWETFAAQFKNALIVILLIATLLSGLLGHALEAGVIAVIVFVAVLLGFIQEHRANRALDALKALSAPLAHVIREGLEHGIPSRDVVRGDVIALHAGDRIPADARVSVAVNLNVDESTLTGESMATSKTVHALAADTPLAERRNMVYAGTVVTHGRGLAVVVATGMTTEFGRISDLVQTVDAGRTPLQENLDTLGRALGKVTLAIVSLIVGAGLWRGLPPIDMLIFGTALAVAVVPEALPAVVTISLAIGVRRMAKRHALVRRLTVVETLGSTSVICTDKTGTLTRNEMTVRELFAGGQLVTVSGVGYQPVGEFTSNRREIALAPAALELLHGGALASDATLRCDGTRWSVHGDPTEGALLVAAMKAGIDLASIQERFPRTAEIPFNSERRRMTTLHEDGELPIAYSKGATDVILDGCSHWAGPSGEVALTAADRARIRDTEYRMASDGLRVLAVAHKHDATLADAEHHMTLLGLVGLADPPRPEAREAVATCLRAGIRPVMMTGDHPATATAVARELGLPANGRVVSGQDLAAMSDAQLEHDVLDISVYGRVSATDKLRVIAAWQKHREIVAMTGDGVNDAPALKKADVGIAMGLTGTDISKEAASITLLDDNFASIVAAVEEGRVVFANIKKYLAYLLSSNVGEILLMAGAAAAGLPLPLTAVQILYVNLATDGLPALALAVDPPEPDLMQHRPRDPRGSIFTRPLAALLMAGAVWSAIANLALLTWLLRSGRPQREAVAMTFMSLVLIQFFNAYNYRSERRSVTRAPFANRWLNLAIAWELLLLGLILYVPWLQVPFSTFALTVTDLGLVTAVAFTVVPLLEAMKWMQRRGWMGDPP